MNDRYRYGLTTKADGTWALEVHEKVDSATEDAARQKLAAARGPSRCLPGVPVVAADGCEWSGSPDAVALYAGSLDLGREPPVEEPAGPPHGDVEGWKPFTWAAGGPPRGRAPEPVDEAADEDGDE